ncbi:MAG: flagellar assembly protein FliW [Clostridia bacterium]|jgi:flagellar assembly factor FliW|nr:flagellar assembly protein FliW [Clostridia bacterium]NLF37767.1 flagellar assembly protein FliW [Clostridiaceae bacterium]
MEKAYPEKIVFKKDIYGFKDIKKYSLSKASENDNNPFKILKAEDESVSFILLDPTIIDKSYNPIINDKIARLLGTRTAEDLTALCIVVIPNDIKRMTINLRSPIIINVSNGYAIQTILEDERYSIRHKILDY